MLTFRPIHKIVCMILHNAILELQLGECDIKATDNITILPSLPVKLTIERSLQLYQVKLHHYVVIYTLEILRTVHTLKIKFHCTSS